jgi:hypothetical protein
MQTTLLALRNYVWMWRQSEACDERTVHLLDSYRYLKDGPVLFCVSVFESFISSRIYCETKQYSVN